MIIKKMLIYLVRWQLSTPILAWCIVIFASWGTTKSTMMANLIGGLIFFWIDRWIFRKKFFGEFWEVKERIICVDCGKEARGYRLVTSTFYDKTTDPYPEFRCEKCSELKYQQERKRTKEK
jgi:hypothetical protein